MMHRLTPMQFAVARLEATGLPRDEIARRVGRSRNYVWVMLSRLRRRLGITTRRELAALLLDCEVREWDYRGSVGKRGMRHGDRVRVIGGHYRGHTGIFRRVLNSTQMRIEINGARCALASHNVERIEEPAA